MDKMSREIQFRLVIKRKIIRGVLKNSQYFSFFKITAIVLLFNFIPTLPPPLLTPSQLDKCYVEGVLVRRVQAGAWVDVHNAP